MRIRNRLLPARLYCRLFEHDDIFVHDARPVDRQNWCQRCSAWLPASGPPNISRRRPPRFAGRRTRPDRGPGTATSG